MTIPCPVCVPCLDPTDPFQNFSTEAPDVDHTFCYGSGNAALLPGPGRNYNVDDCLITWGPISCYATGDESCQVCVESNKWECQPKAPTRISLPDLCANIPSGCLHTVPQSCLGLIDLCAGGFGEACATFDESAKCVAATNCFFFPPECIACPDIPTECEGDPSQCPQIPEQCFDETSQSPIIPDDKDDLRIVYWNSAVAAMTTCPDGTPVVFICQAHRFADWSKVKANEKAASYAAQQVQARKICLSELNPSECCKDQPYLGAIKASGRFVSATSNRWQIIEGALPPGLELNYSQPFGGAVVPIRGTPKQAGVFNFRVRVTLPFSNDSVDKAYQLCVVGITPDALPDAQLSAPYSEMLEATACATPPLSWQVTPNTALPPGLVLDEQTGEISGIPTVPGVYNFTILLQTEAT
jgi:hypothetical protein